MKNGEKAGARGKYSDRAHGAPPCQKPQARISDRNSDFLSKLLGTESANRLHLFLLLTSRWTDIEVVPGGAEPSRLQYLRPHLGRVLIPHGNQWNYCRMNVADNSVDAMSGRQVKGTASFHLGPIVWYARTIDVRKGQPNLVGEAVNRPLMNSICTRCDTCGELSHSILSQISTGSSFIDWQLRLWSLGPLPRTIALSRHEGRFCPSTVIPMNVGCNCQLGYLDSRYEKRRNQFFYPLNSSCFICNQVGLGRIFQVCSAISIAFNE